MQLDLPDTPKQTQHESTSQSPLPSDQHGPQCYHASGSPHGLWQQRERSMSPRSVSRSVSETELLRPLGQAVHPDFLEERLLRLSVRGQSSAEQPTLAGQRIAEYENALTPSVPRQALGFKVIKRADNETARVDLADFPNGMRSLARHSFVTTITLTRTYRDPDAHPLALAPRLPRLRGLGVEAILRLSHHTSRMAHGFSALLPRPRCIVDHQWAKGRGMGRGRRRDCPVRGAGLCSPGSTCLLAQRIPVENPPSPQLVQGKARRVFGRSRHVFAC